MASNVPRAVILKATFAACLLSPRPTSVPQDEINTFHTSLERALSHCSQANIQTCKAWLLRFVASSPSRVQGLVNYLEALAESPPPSQPTGSKVSPKSQRLNILYLISDLLHHCKYHIGTPTTFATVIGSLHLRIVDLVSHAANCDRQKNPRHHRRLDDLLDIWSKHGYFNPELVDKLRQVVALGIAMDPNNANSAKKSGKDVPFIMPARHGDPSTIWQDTPAGNILPHLVPGSTSPIQPSAIRPIELPAGPADKRLADSVQALIDDVNKLFDSEAPVDAKHSDLDQLGQKVTRSATTGDILDGETYYGWPLDFWQPTDTGVESSADRSRSPSVSRTDSNRPRSRESSYTPHESSTSHFPPPHQPQHLPAPYNPFSTTHPSNGQYAHPPMGPSNGYTQVPAPNYGSWPPPPPHMPTMPFPTSGPGSSSAFPPPYQHNPSMPQEQRQGNEMSQGQHYFPAPHSGGRAGAPRGRRGRRGRGW
ncbi:hypothetical protein ACN38_g801 [Penicillium nordicum]|uniref:CID domain-containing protein n=1 Tax=Penicillium nordicum TaxID=229535 RepID=A0A0M8PHE2_9EURO|nr:hypothetical protein ACN38_g801 [Penicillium nordicum]